MTERRPKEGKLLATTVDRLQKLSNSPTQLDFADPPSPQQHAATMPFESDLRDSRTLMDDEKLAKYHETLKMLAPKGRVSSTATPTAAATTTCHAMPRHAAAPAPPLTTAHPPNT